MRTRRTTIALAALLAIALLAVACGSGETTSAGDGDGDGEGTGDDPSPTAVDGDWVLVDGTVDGRPLVLLDANPVTLELAGDQISGTAACNGYGGDFSLDGDALTLGPLAITEMACIGDGVMELESAYMDGLGRSDTMVADGDTLTVSGPDVTLGFQRVAPTEAADLFGTTWVLDTFLDGDTASSTTGGTTQAILTLGPGDAFSAFTGCRQLAGEAVFEGGTLTLRFPTEGADVAEDGCDEADRQQDAAQVAVYEQPDLKVSIDGQRLTLLSAGGTGLSFVAQSR